MAKKCDCPHCLHASRIFAEDDETITVVNKTYHTDCYEVQNRIAQVCDLFWEKINKNVVYGNLRKVVNEIVYVKGIHPDVLYFGINYYLDNHLSLNYPAGLFYVIQNKKMMEAYSRTKVKKLNYKFEVEIDKENKYSYKQENNGSFGNILAR